MQDLALRKYKKILCLDKNQISVLVGSILGDGTLQIGKEGRNANFKTEQGLKQKEYVWWKYNYFRDWVKTPPKMSYRYQRDGTRYAKSLWFRTLRHPQLTFFRKLFYQKGKKIIPSNIKKYLNSLCLAVWIMDDGSYNDRIIDISTYSFDLKSIALLQKSLNELFSIKAKYFKDRNKGYRMYFSRNETREITKIISPYIIPSMAYKLPK